MARHDDLAAEEISCSECFELLSVGVERELAGTTLAPVLTRLAQHVGQCGVCREPHQTLRDFVRSEAAGVPPLPGEASPGLGLASAGPHRNDTRRVCPAGARCPGT